MSTSSMELSRQYTTFAGTDILVVVDGESIGSLQAISYAVQREKAPVYVMGRVNPLSFSRGKRGIAGTIVTLMLDQHMMFSATFRDKRFLDKKDEIYPTVQDVNDASSLANFNQPNQVFAPGDLSSNYQISQAQYVDQLPPFDVVIVAANEQGKSATMRVYGIEILNEGSGFSVDDLVIDNQMTYVCRALLPWQRLGDWDFNTGRFEGANGTV